MTDTVSMSYRKPYREDVIIKKKKWNAQKFDSLIFETIIYKVCPFTTNDVKWRLSFLGVWMKSDSPLIVTVCMIFDSAFLDVIRMSKSTGSFLAQLGSGFFFLQNAFLWLMI